MFAAALGLVLGAGCLTGATVLDSSLLAVAGTVCLLLVTFARERGTVGFRPRWALCGCLLAVVLLAFVVQTLSS